MLTPGSLAAAGFAVWCTVDGTILRVAHDSLGLAPELAPDRSISLLVEAGSLSKLFDFLLAARQQGIALGWELNVNVQGQIETLHFVGMAVSDGLLIIGARNRTNLWQLYDELIGLANEQANLVRSLLKDAMDPRQTSPTPLSERVERDNAVYDEISRLNNDLAKRLLQ